MSTAEPLNWARRHGVFLPYLRCVTDGHSVLTARVRATIPIKKWVYKDRTLSSRPSELLRIQRRSFKHCLEDLQCCPSWLVSFCCGGADLWSVWASMLD